MGVRVPRDLCSSAYIYGRMLCILLLLVSGVERRTLLYFSIHLRDAVDLSIVSEVEDR